MRLAGFLLGLILPLFYAGTGFAYVPNARWTSTASGSTGPTGRPVTLTWSFAPDGASIPGEGANGLISFLDTTFGTGPGGSNFTLRPWFSMFNDSFARWSQLSGVTFQYESHDTNSPLRDTSGALGVRGDIRIAGTNIDGLNDTLAYTWFPNSGDIVIDTDDAAFFDPTPFTSLNFRNTFMHEIGHALGIDHVESNTNQFLMEPVISTSFEGPQLDDIRGVQAHYGDALEKTNGGAGNNIAANATSLGALVPGTFLRKGSAAVGDQVVGAAETDFVSIANSSDTDFYSFTISSPASLTATLTPLGGVFNQAPTGQLQQSFNANARSDLTLAILASNGSTMLAVANATGAGQVETIIGLNLLTGGTYYARITGADNDVQPYELSLTSAGQLTGDYNRNGAVDTADYVLWRNTLNQSGANLAADGSGNNFVDPADYSIWRSNFGKTAGNGAGGGLSELGVPEPGGLVLLLSAAVLCSTRRRR
jgi:serralysin